MYYRLVDDDRADQLETRLEQSFDNHRLEAAEPFAHRQFDNLLSRRPAEPFPWMIFEILAHKERGNEEAIQPLCKEMSLYVHGNGNLTEIAMDAYVLLRETEARKRIAEEARNAPFVWEWERKPLELHAGRVASDRLIEEAFPFPDQMCIAHYTVGLHLLSEGRRDLAIKHFHIVEKTGRYGWHDYHAAKAFLKRLEDPKDDFPKWIPDASPSTAAETIDD
jgi:hypothetical protein